MANFAKDEFSAANAYVLSMLGEDYGSGLATYFVNAFEDLGGTVTSEQFPEGTSDFSAYIQNAINAGADVIFAPCATTYAAQIITQAASAGFDKPITAGDTWESSVILDAQKGTSVQVYCSTFFDENDDSGAAKEFVTGFKEWLNADSQKLTNNGGNDIVAAVSALGYDGYMVALEAIKAAGSTDGTAIRPMVSSMDHKRAGDGDTGLNTGGMGTVAPNPCYTPDIAQVCMDTIFLPTLAAMRAEGCPFKGCLYFGLMLTPDGPKVIEYNCRFGDPETQVVLPRLESDLVEIMLAVAEGRHEDVQLERSDDWAVSVVLASEGYPGAYEKGKVILGIEEAEELPAVTVFHAGTRRNYDGELLTNGGRVLNVVAKLSLIHI